MAAQHHAELLPIEKRIIKTLDGRSFNRIQMQIPFKESSIIFLASNVPQHSSLWTSCLIELVNHDMKQYGGTHFYPKAKTLKGVFEDGLVQLPKALNYNGVLGIARTPTACLLRILKGMDAGPYNGLIDTFRNTPEGMRYVQHSLKHKFTNVEWVCPDVPPGGIVVWHGFHTTKGDKGSIEPKATMFMDYTERSVLPGDLCNHYTELIRKQPFDPGSGTLNTRSSRPTIEFNAAKNISQVPLLPPTRLTGGLQPDALVGTLHVNRNAILRQGYGVIVPLQHGASVPNGCFPWYMTQVELQNYHFLRRNAKFEFERFLTYFVFEREMRFLTCWLARYAPEKPGFSTLWDIMKRKKELFDSETRRFYRPDIIEMVLLQNGQPQQEKELQALYGAPRNQTLANMTPEQIVQFHYNSWVALFRFARLLNVNTRPVQAIFAEQARCWFGMFGGKYGTSNIGGNAAAERVFNDKFFMYWRLGMGSQGPSKTGGPAMCVGTTMDDLNAFIERKVNDGPVAHLHRRMAQGGGKKVANDSGMGPATTYMHGSAHLQMQTGPFGATLAHAFYQDPLVVLERFRVKTHASWGAGHVDHDVQSRPRELFHQYVSL